MVIGNTTKGLLVAAGLGVAYVMFRVFHKKKPAVEVLPTTPLPAADPKAAEELGQELAQDLLDNHALDTALLARFRAAAGLKPDGGYDDDVVNALNGLSSVDEYPSVQQVASWVLGT